MQHGIKESRPVKSYLKWANRIPRVFVEAVLKGELLMKKQSKMKNLSLFKHIETNGRKTQPIFLKTFR